MELNNAIYDRRSVRKFTTEQVTDEQINTILKAAQMAPSWANTQVWEFVVVRDKTIIKELTDLYSLANPARECSFSASAIIVVCAKKNISGCKQGIQRTKFNEWFMFDLGMASQNISLLAHSMGLGTVIVGSMEHEKINKLLKLPTDVESVITIPIGVPTQDEIKTPRRKDLSEITHQNFYAIKNSD